MTDTRVKAGNPHGLRRYTRGTYILQNRAGGFRDAVQYFRDEDRACERVRMDRRQGLSVFAVSAADLLLGDRS